VCIVQSGLSAAELLARAEAHKLIRKRDATEAAVHDSQKLDDVLDLSNTGKGVWADSAYRSVQIEAGLKEKGLQSRIHRRAARDRPLSERQKSANDALMQTPPRGYEASAGFAPSGDLLVARCHCNLVARCHCNPKFRVGPRN
jgi:IS5 family transposase